MALSQPSVHQLYRRLETIGKGAYGSVHKGEHIPTGNVVALKIINLDDKSGSDDVGDIQREVALLSQLRDAPNITRYYGCYMDGPRVWIVMEFAQGGSVLSLMKASKNKCLEEKYVAVIVREVLVGLSYLHKVPVIHRDIKAANILVTATGKVVICDFGVSALLATSFSKRNTLTGTPHWMAPELLQTLPVYDTKADIWSLGISIYEMIKGSPPHHNLENIKVMDLIPKTQPPRFQDNEASKDSRDFIAMCLREAPTERLPADELSKSKWIKSVSKVNVSILKDLVMRFEQAAKRASLADPLDWEEEEERDLLRLDVQDENPWEFDTVRGPSFRESSSEGIETFDTEDDDNDKLVRVMSRSPPSSIPLSLRGLFEDDDQEPLRPPASQFPSHQNIPSSPASSSPGRERVPPRRLLTPDSTSNEHTAKPKTFVHPPRNLVPSRLKRPPNVSESDDNATRTSDSVPASISRVPLSLTPDQLSVNSDELKKVYTWAPQLGGGDIPSGSDNLDASDDEKIGFETSPAATITPDLPSLAPNPPNVDSSTITRKRSQSTGEALTPRRNGRSDLDLASPHAFQFPVPHDNPSPGRTLNYQSNWPQYSPTRLNTSTLTPSGHTTHQVTYSLDTSAASRRTLTSNSLSPPPISRTRSATTLPDALIEAAPTSKGSNFDVTPSITTLKPSVLATRSRSGSDAGHSNSSSAPGLKDVLKIQSLTSEHHLGMSDILLPPSPSAAVYNARTFLPLPSALSSSVSASSIDTHVPSGVTRDVTSSVSPSLAIPRSQSPLPLRRTVTEPTITPFIPERGAAHARKLSSGTTLPSMPQNGPALRPLDYSKLTRGDNTYAELARTINDLSQWLSVVEAGLNGMLDKVYTDTIEEEQEIPSDLEDSPNASTLHLHKETLIINDELVTRK